MRLAGLGQTAGRIAWVLVPLPSLVSFAFSLYSLNIWDRVPADQQSRYFPGMSAQDVQIYFVDFFINQVFSLLCSQAFLQGFRAGIFYVLIYEPVWYALEIILAAGLAILIFRKKIQESCIIKMELGNPTI